MNMPAGDKMCMDKGMCKCSHHKIKPVLMLVLGVLFLLNALNVIAWSTVYISGSIFLIILAAGKMCKCCKGMCMKSCDQSMK